MLTMTVVTALTGVVVEMTVALDRFAATFAAVVGAMTGVAVVGAITYALNAGALADASSDMAD